MTVIVQEETTGASVANIIGQPYAAVKARANSMGIFADDEALYSNTQYVRNLLEEYDIRTSSNEVPFTCWDALPNIALLSIKHHKENNRAFWHWVVFMRVQGNAVVLDSAISSEGIARTDSQNMQPKWFIAVTKT